MFISPRPNISFQLRLVWVMMIHRPLKATWLIGLYLLLAGLFSNGQTSMSLRLFPGNFFLIGGLNWSNFIDDPTQTTQKSLLEATLAWFVSVLPSLFYDTPVPGHPSPVSMSPWQLRVLSLSPSSPLLPLSPHLFPQSWPKTVYQNSLVFQPPQTRNTL